jgi:hypothetical protein
MSGTAEGGFWSELVLDAARWAAIGWMNFAMIS